VSHSGKSYVSLIVALIYVLTGFMFVACSSMPDKSEDNDATTRPAELTTCPDRPSCVSTSAKNPGQFIEPLQFSDSRKFAQERLRRIIQRLPRSTITVDQPGYMVATVRSELFGFTDDMEFLLDTEKNIVHFRSGARIGYYDFGVNRRRMHAIAQEFQASK
jgi:uncharacterized protein (DUF1499 family)